MSKISSYSLADEPLQLSDRLIGTEAPRPTPSATPLATKNFSLGELLQLFSSEFPAASLQAVLDTGNTATQNITLTGTITTSVIKPGEIEDSVGSQGETFQFLSKASSGVNWVDLPNTYPTLDEVLDAGNISSLTPKVGGISLFDGIGYVNIEGNSNQFYFSNRSNFTFAQIYQDNILLKDLNGYSFKIQKPSDISNNHTAFLQDISGTIAYLGDIPTPISLTTIGDSGPATLIGDTLNIPNYSGGSATVPTLDEVLNAGDTSSLSAFVGGIGLYDSSILEYYGIVANDEMFLFKNNLGSNIFAVGYSEFSLYNGTGAIAANFSSALLTSTRNFQLPNASGTIALTSDIPSLTGYVPTSRTLTINGTSYDLTADRTWTIPTGTGTVTSVGLSMPSAFNVANSPITSSGTIAVTGAGTVSQYVRGDGTLANFPNSTGGGASVNYYLNGSISQGTFGGATYYQMSKTPILGAGTNFIRTNGAGNGYIASFLTDAGDPSFLNIPGGNWNLEFYFQSSASGGNPKFYGEIYKVSATNVFTLVASGSANPESITNGTTVDQYYTSIPMPQTSLLITDRLAIRIYVITGGRTITLHTENGNLCEVLTTFTTGLTALNGLTSQVQYFAVGTSGTDFNISSATDTHTFNLPTASATNRGALSSADWTTFNGKQNALTNPITGTGANGQVAFFNGATTQTGDNGLFWDDTNKRLEIFNSSVGVGIAPLIVRNNVPYQSPFTQFIQVWQNSGGGILASVRADGRIFSSNDVNSNYFVGNITGSVSSPVFRLGSNGLFFPNSSNLGFVTNSTERMRITDTGNIVIGATTAGARLDVRAQGALSTDIAFRVRNSADTANILDARGNGNVLIGSATDAGYKLDVNGTARFSGIVRYNNTSSNYLNIDGSNTGSNNCVISNRFNQIQIATNTGAGAPHIALLPATGGAVGINTSSPNASAITQIDSTTQGFLPPRMTNAQRIAIATPAVGLCVYCTDVVEGLYINKSTGWTYIG